MSGDHCGLLGLSLLSTLWKLCGLHLRIVLPPTRRGERVGAFIMNSCSPLLESCSGAVH